VQTLYSDSVSTVEYTSGVYPPQRILPRLKVRVHLVDITCGKLRDDVQSLKDRFTEESTAKEYCWVWGLFQTPRNKDQDPCDKHDHDTTVRNAARHLRRLSPFDHNDFELCTSELEHFPRIPLCSAHTTT
jgi:hypothetical protein